MNQRLNRAFCASVPAFARTGRPRAILIAAAGLCAGVSGAYAQVPSYTINRLGFVGGVYTNGLPTVNAPSGTLSGLTSSGLAFGRSNRFLNGTGATTTPSLGADTWYYNATSNSLIGFTGGAYEYAFTSNSTAPNQTGIFRSSNIGLFAVNDLGQVGGTSARYSSVAPAAGAAAATAGQDAWIYDPTAASPTSVQVGFTGTGYSLAPTGANTNATRSSSVIAKHRMLASSTSRVLAGALTSNASMSDSPATKRVSSASRRSLVGSTFRSFRRFKRLSA